MAFLVLYILHLRDRISGLRSLGNIPRVSVLQCDPRNLNSLQLIYDFKKEPKHANENMHIPHFTVELKRRCWGLYWFITVFKMLPLCYKAAHILSVLIFLKQTSVDNLLKHPSVDIFQHSVYFFIKINLVIV